MNTMSRRLALLAAVLLIAVACGPQPLPVAPTPIPTLAPATLPVQTATQPPAAGETATLPPAGQVTPTADLVQAGSQIFQQNCAVCHNLTSEPKVGPGLAGLFGISNLPNGQPFNEDNLKGWIRSGGGGMPGFPLADDQMTALIAFLQDATK
jgi:mono/diheme cytochrome c family protein